jgi:hypothetical protein
MGCDAFSRASPLNLARAPSRKCVPRWKRKSRPSAGPGSTGCSVALRMMEPVWLISDQPRTGGMRREINLMLIEAWRIEEERVAVLADAQRVPG